MLWGAWWNYAPSGACWVSSGQGPRLCAQVSEPGHLTPGGIHMASSPVWAVACISPPLATQSTPCCIPGANLLLPWQVVWTVPRPWRWSVQKTAIGWEGWLVATGWSNHEGSGSTFGGGQLVLGPLRKLARSIPGSCVLVMLLNSWLEHLLRALWVIEKYTLCTFLLFACWLMCMGADRLLFNLTSMHLACSFNRMI